MSQKRRPASQNSQRSKKDPVPETAQEPVDIDDLVNKCVRFFVFQMGRNVPILRQKLIQQVFRESPGKTADLVVKRAAKILDNVYGVELQLLESDTNNIKKYVLINKLTHFNLVTESPNEDFKALISMLSLAHIFMNKGICSERSLWGFLEVLEINPGTKVGTETAENFINKTLTKEQIICFESKVTAEGNVTKKVRWGPYADQSVSKRDLLQFYSEVYDGMDVTGWAQNEEADLQNNEADLQNDVEVL